MHRYRRLHPGAYQFAPAETPEDGTPEYTLRVEDAEAEVPLTVQEALQRVAQVQQDLATPRWQPRPVEWDDWLARLRAGDRVYLRGIPQPVEVITPSDGETLEVLLGAMRARLPVHRVERPASGAPSAPERLFMSLGPRPQPNRTLDLRGRRVEDALSEVDLFLDRAARAGAPDLRIIHGVGDWRFTLGSAQSSGPTPHGEFLPPRRGTVGWGHDDRGGLAGSVLCRGVRLRAPASSEATGCQLSPL